MSRRSLITVCSLALGLLAALVLALVLTRPASHTASTAPASAPLASTAAAGGFDGAAIPAGGPVHNFTLTDQNGRRVSLSDFRGQVVVLSFLYSHCGGTCRVIAQQIRGSLDELPHPVPVLIVSADPQGDTPASVRSFLAQASLSGRAHYLSGSLASLRPIWRAYEVTPASAGPSAFDEYASVLLLDRRGAERVLFESEQLTPESLTHDIGRLQGD